MTQVFLPTPPPPTRLYAEDDGHDHVYGLPAPYSAREGATPPRKYRSCVLPGCVHTQVWDVRY